MQTSSVGPVAGPSVPRFTFEPLLSAAPAALAPEPALGIARVVLIEEGLAWRNAFNEITVRKADDLLACAAEDGALYDLIPKGADLMEVTLEFYFEGSPEPHWAELKPPRGMVFQHPGDADRILAFLTRRGFAAES